MKAYSINEMFHSLQGEGVRAGTVNWFLRFTGCNLRCDVATGPLSPGGFACDTEFESGVRMTASEIIGRMISDAPGTKSVILTGGEPTLQLDVDLVTELKAAGYYLAIETNGTRPVPEGLDWVTVSPKVAEHAVKQLKANEVKYVRAYGQNLPKTAVEADHYLLSPAFEGGELDRRNLEWCVGLCKKNPKWRLSVQNHKAWRVR